MFKIHFIYFFDRIVIISMLSSDFHSQPNSNLFPILPILYSYPSYILFKNYALKNFTAVLNSRHVVEY